jgi:hypothetical protein
MTQFLAWCNQSPPDLDSILQAGIALRDIQALLSYGALIQNPAKGRSTSYRLPTEEELYNDRLR